jgi:hypothetical protein
MDCVRSFVTERMWRRRLASQYTSELGAAYSPAVRLPEMNCAMYGGRFCVSFLVTR